MDEKEDGEISGDTEDSFGLSYQPVKRPDANQYRHIARHMPSSDEEYSSDSDSDAPSAPKRKPPPASRMETTDIESHDPKGWMTGDGETEERVIAKAKRRNNIWSTVMQEQVLSQEIGGFGLKRRLDQGDRNVESYDYREALKLRGIEAGPSDDEEETEESINKRMFRKRHVKERLNYRKAKTDKPRELAEVTVEDSMTDEQVGLTIAEALLERKPELVVRVVEVLGREKALELYKETQQLERDGGLLILNGSRRRTSGGVYIQLLKDLPTLGKDELAKILPPEESSMQQWRIRKRAHRKRERHESKPQGEDVSEEGLHLGGLFSDDPGGAKCPGSTPVTTPQPSDNEEEDLAVSTINQLSPSAMPEQVPASPPTVADPRMHRPGELTQTFKTFNGGVSLQPNPGAAEERSVEAYDDDFLDIHGNTDEMDLF